MSFKFLHLRYSRKLGRLTLKTKLKLKLRQQLPLRLNRKQSRLLKSLKVVGIRLREIAQQVVNGEGTEIEIGKEACKNRQLIYAT